MKAHPKLDGGPNSTSEPALEKKMSRRLLLLVAKLKQAAADGVT
jgi:hypothetical protein